MANIVDSAVLDHLQRYSVAIGEAWTNKPPEFTSMSYYTNPEWRSNVFEFYEMDQEDEAGFIANPLRTEWFEYLVTDATMEDLEAFEESLNRWRTVLRYFQETLIHRAASRDLLGEKVSSAIPAYFRKTWSGLEKPWKCEA